MAWLPADFAHPTRVPVGKGHHLRPITAADWPFTQPRYVGRDLSWADWLTLPDTDTGPIVGPPDGQDVS